jgi:hypothetical protein
MKKLVLLLSICILFSSCESNSEINHPIQGKWNVIQIMGGLSTPIDYEVGTFTWDFDLENKTVTIVNVSTPFNGLETPSFVNNQGGTYSFEIITENNIDYLVVGNRKGRISFTEEGLTIDYGIAFDDIAYIFKR